MLHHPISVREGVIINKGFGNSLEQLEALVKDGGE